MPDLATVDATVTVVGWLKEVGNEVRRGEPLLEVETDKAILPVESPVFGVLSEITAAERFRSGNRGDDRAFDGRWTNGRFGRLVQPRNLLASRSPRPASFPRSPRPEQTAGRDAASRDSRAASFLLRAQSPGADR